MLLQGKSRVWCAAWLRAVVVCLAAVVSVSCSAGGTFVWAEAATEADFTRMRIGAYVIAPGDTLAVRVIGQEALATRGRVRSDGRISVPLIGEIVAAGLTPEALADELEQRLDRFLVAPSVSVAVEEMQPVAIVVIGEVGRPGTYEVAPDGSVIAALAAAGGLTEFADGRRIFVLRTSGGRAARIRFTYERLIRGAMPDAAFTLRPGDAVIVE